jgi:anti-sigma factor RsiW
MILHGEMTPMQRQTFEAHIRMCEPCRHMVARWRLCEPPDGAA